MACNQVFMYGAGVRSLLACQSLSFTPHYLQAPGGLTKHVKNTVGPHYDCEIDQKAWLASVELESHDIVGRSPLEFRIEQLKIMAS